MGKKQSDREQSFAELIRKTKLPILTLDERWHTIFKKENKSREIKHLEERLNKELKRQGKITNELKELKSLKQKLMAEIVQNMDSSSDGKRELVRQKKLEKSRKLIEEINEKLAECEDQQMDLPREIHIANEELMLRSADEMYQRIRANEQELKELTEWIDATRIELKKRILIKQDREEQNANMYAYLHDMLGPEFMEAFDDAHKK